jgi:hypothetical protein
MKKEILQQHKEATLVCEERIFEVEAISNLSIPQISKTILVQKKILSMLLYDIPYIILSYFSYF